MVWRIKNGYLRVFLIILNGNLWGSREGFPLRSLFHDFLGILVHLRSVWAYQTLTDIFPFY